MSQPGDRCHSGDLDYGPVCPVCAGPKHDQSFLCKPCRYDAQRDTDYYERRTCPDCGGPKKDSSARCLSCAHERRRGAPVASGRAQTLSHPWRRAA